MFARIFAVGLMAGIVVGGLSAVLQLTLAVPLIQAAEVYEAKAESSAPVASNTHDHGDAWEPADGIERSLWTVIANLLAGVAGGLLLAGAFALRGASDLKVGLLWGAGAYLAFSLMPALGLPPELPGTAAAGLYARQAWWIGTALATIAGLTMLAWRPLGWARLAGLAVIAVPHIVGAPHPDMHDALAPADLQQQFIVVALGVSALFWVLLGGLTGYLGGRVGVGAPAQTSPA